jgi:hypothetical protein
MATLKACRAALEDLSAMLAGVEPELRAKHVPDRVVACRLTDLGRTFVGRIGPHGMRDLHEADSCDPPPDARVSMTSDELVALARGDEDFLHAWLRGRVQVSASMRDLLRLRSLFGL